METKTMNDSNTNSAKIAVTMPINFDKENRSAQIAQGIDYVAHASGTLRGNIQILAVQVLTHVIEHGNNGHANDLVKSLGNGMRKDALEKWFVKSGMMILGRKDKKKENPLELFVITSKVDEARKNETIGSAVVITAGNLSWWEAKVASTNEFDFAAYLTQALSKITKEYKKNEKCGVTPEFIAQLTTMKTNAALNKARVITTDEKTEEIDDQNQVVNG